MHSTHMLHLCIAAKIESSLTKIFLSQLHISQSYTLENLTLCTKALM